MMLVLFVAAGFNLITNLIFIPAYSYLAAAIISVLTEIIVVIGTFIIVKKEFHYFPHLKNLKGLLGAGVVMSLTLFSLRNINFLIAGIISLFVYSVVLWLFKVIATDELTILLAKE